MNKLKHFICLSLIVLMFLISDWNTVFAEGEKPKPDTNSIVTTYFNKKYDGSLYNKIIQIDSITEAIQFIKRQNIRVFNIGTRYIDISDTPPAFLRAHYKDVVTQAQDFLRDSGKPKPNTIALSIYRGLKIGTTTYNHDAIFIDDNIELSLLVHEFTHHLFEREERKSGDYINYHTVINTFLDTQKDFFSAYDEFTKTYSVDSECEREPKLTEVCKKDFISLMNKLKLYIDAVHNVVKRKLIEEALVELIQLHEFKDGQLSYNSFKSLENTLTYAISHFSASFSIYDNINQIIENLSNFVHQFEEPALDSELKLLMSYQTKIRDNIRDGITPCYREFTEVTESKDFQSRQSQFLEELKKQGKK